MLLVSALLVLSASSAFGQIRDEAEDAAALVDDANVALGAAEGERSAALEDLIRSVAEWNAVLGQQTDLAFEVAELRNQLAEAEAEVSAVKERVRQRVVESYMAGGSGLAGLLSADGAEELSAVEIVFDTLNRNAVDDIRSLEESTLGMEAMRMQLAADEGALEVQGAGVVTLIDELDILFAEASSDVTAAHAALVAADADYAAAFTLLQQMTELQRASGRGVERWRPIVEHYFPPERVEQALEVMWCESRGNPEATHPLSDAAGLFQFMEQTWGFVSPRAGYEGVSRYDPEANIASAAWLLEFTIERGHDLGDWGRWSCQPTSAVE